MMRHEVYITPNEVKVDGKALNHKENGAALLTELYRAHIGDYPKFFKMDTLCKLGFVASELLLQADTAYQATIQDPENFFPSPAAFVYTLPNIVTGEIAIRNKYFGETSFIVLEDFDEKIMMRELQNAFQDPMTKSILGGWLDCTDENHFESKLYLIFKL